MEPEISIQPSEQTAPQPISPPDKPLSHSEHPQAEAPPKKERHILRGFFYFLVIVAISVGFWQRQNIIDWWKLRNYTPSVAVATLATESNMNQNGRKILYLQKPLVQSKAEFYVSCEEGETEIVLGCYKPNKGIYVLKVDDQRLEGVEQVTTAHEMLHAAYDRLSTGQRNKASLMLQSAYKKITDKDIIEKIDVYKKSDADISNELHSILGTEVGSLPADLEEYYKQYFTNRQTVVNLANGYKAEFKTRKAKVAAIDVQLKNIETQVIADNKQLDIQQAEFTKESKRLDELLKQGNIEEYNSGVVAYNKDLVPFRNKLAKTRDLVSQYKVLLTERNKLAAEAQELNRALDSRIQTTVEDI